MSRRQSLDRPGILSPPGPFLTPSPSPSISASPRLQPSPSLSPFPQDVLLVTGNPLTNASTHEQERKTVTPGRRQSIHQFTNGSPNAGTVVFQPSPSQSPAAATSVVGVTAGSINVITGLTGSGATATTSTTGHELNATLVGSNNIQLNKKGTKRQQHQHLQHHQIFNNNNNNNSGHYSTNSATTAIAGGYGQLHASTINNSPHTFATATVACSPKSQTKKSVPNGPANATATTAAVLSTSQQQTHQSQQSNFQQYHSNSPLIADSPSPSPSNTITAASIKPPTPQPMQMLQQQFTLSTNSPSNGPQQTFQLIQGPQGQIIAAATQQQQQRFANTNTVTSNQNGKSAKVPQQILPKPNQPQFQSQLNLENISQLQPLQPTTATQVHNPNQQHQKTKNLTNSSTNNNSNNNNSAINTSSNMSQQLPQISQSPQPTQQATQQQIILPSGATASLTATQQPLLLNQVPVLVQQNTPQGVQLILRPPTPQLTATPSLVIQNTRPQPQLQAQQQPQQLLRILGTNGATMQLAAATPTFIVSSQANLIQQATNLQTIKTNPQTPAITQISGLHAALSAAAAANTQPRSQQFATTAATINGHLLGPSMAAQLQNLQLAAAAAANGNGITAQIQMPNGLNASAGPTLLSQLPSANFQQGTTSSLINLNQLNGTNIHQLAAAAAAAGATFQTPAVPTQSSTSTNGNNANAVSSNSNTSTDLFNGHSPGAGLTNLTQSSSAPSPMTVTSEAMRQPTPVLQNMPANPQQVSGAQIQLSLNAAATIQLQQQQQQQQQAQIQQLQQQIQQTQNQVQQAQKQVQLQQQQPPPEPAKKKPRPRKKKQPGASNVQNAAVSNSTAINSVNSTSTIAAVVKTFTTTTNRPLNSTTSSTIAIPTTITTSNSNVMVPSSITANATLTTTTATNHTQPYGNATTAQHESQMQMNLISNQMTQIQQQPAKSPSPPPQITRASNGKLDLGNVMKLCGIMEDDDDEDYNMETGVMSASSGDIVQHQDNGHNSAEISISLPQTENQSEALPYTLTIPGTTTTAMTGDANVQGPAANIVIKIDAGDSGLSSSTTGVAPYSITIPSLPSAEEINAQAQQMATMSQQIKPSLPHVPTSINFSLPIGQIGSLTSTSFPTPGSIHNNIITSMAGRISTSTSSATTAATVTATATATTTTTTATIKPRRKPAAKRNNKKQETNNVNAVHTPSTSTALQNTSASISSNINQANSTTLANSATNSSSNTINAAALVPSHIGNIQISQIDANRLAQNTNNMLNTSLGAVVDNKIQIMPIIEKIAASTTTTAQLPAQTQQVVFQSPGIQTHNSAITGTALGDNQTRQMHLVALPQTSNSGSSSAISISNSSATLTTPSLSMPQQINQQINQTATNLTAATSTAPITPVSSQLPGVTGNLSISVGSPATIAALIPQLTGSLTLAVSEQCERLILRHDPSQPQDQQSQLILQALLKGALPNVTIINESSKVEGINKIPLQIPTPQSNPSIASTSCTTTMTSTTGTTSKQPKKLATQKQIVNANNSDSSSSSKQVMKKIPDLGSACTPSLSQQQRYVALPKIDANTQQLFCLNTLNNQITPISPNQTTASIAPTERLLIAPAGINAQQLAQCLQQGQIHFNDVNPPAAQNQTSTSVVTQPLNNQQPKQQIVHPLASSANSVSTLTTSSVNATAASATVTSLTTQTNASTTTATITTKQVANVAPIIDQSKAAKQDNKQNALIGTTSTNTGTVQKKKPVRKPKASTTTAADIALMKNATVVKPLPKLDPLSQKPNNNPIQIVQPNTVSGKPVTSNPCLTSTSTNVTTTTSTSNIASVPPFQTTQVASGTKLVGVTAPMQQQTQSNNIIQQQPQNSLNMLRQQGNNGNVFGLGFSSISSISTTISSTTSSNSINNTNTSIQNGPPSLTSIQQNNINPSTGSSTSTTTPPQQQQFQPQHTVSRVQTIQLTPQQQQMFRQVQMQIQYLTYKMQHKSMVSSLPLPPEFDANIIAPFNKAMTEMELNTSLQRLFLEQQSILASGKEIPTPEGFIANTGGTGNGSMNFTTLMQPPVLMDNNKSSITNNNSTIPANVVQPNNHSNSPNNPNTNNSNNNNNATGSSSNASLQQTTQRIHIYPIQHHQHKAKLQKNTQQTPQQQMIPSSQSILNCSTANIIHNNNNVSSATLTTTTATMQQQLKTTSKPKLSQTTVNSLQQTQQLTPTQTPQLPQPHPPPPPLTAQSLQISLSPILQSTQQQQMINISNMPAMLQQKHFTQHLQQQILQQQQKLQNAKCPPSSLATLNSQNFNISTTGVVGGPPPLIFPNSSIILAQQHHQPTQQLPTSTPQLPQPQLPTLPTLPTSFSASLANQKPVIGNSNIVTSVNSNSASSNFPNSNSLTAVTTLATMPTLTASSTPVATSSVTVMQITTSSSVSSFSTSTTSTASITISSTAAITAPSTSASLTVTALPTITTASVSGNTSSNTNNNNSIYVTSNNNTSTSYPDTNVGTSTTTSCLPIIGLKTEDQSQMSPKQKLARLSLFLQQLEVDQRSCLRPDYKNPFQTKEETVKKLIRYHCFYQTDEDIPIEEEEEFERTAQRFQDKFRLLSGKFQEILLQESMLPHRTSELCQMEQLVIEDLKQEIEESRRLEKELKVYEQQQIEYIKHGPPAQYQNQSSSIGFEQVKNELKSEPAENKSILDLTVNGTDSNSNFTNHSQQSTSSPSVSESTFDSIKSEIKTDSCTNSQSSQSVNKSSNCSLDSFDVQKPSATASNKQQQSPPNQMPLTKAAKKEDIFNNWNQSFLESGKTSGNSYYNHLANSTNSMPKPTYSLYNRALKKPPSSQETKPPVKEDFENFDIESEITPSFIMKKVEPKSSIKTPTPPAAEQQSPTTVSDEKTNCNSSKNIAGEDRNNSYVVEQQTQNLLPCQKSSQVCSTQIPASNHFVFSNHVNASNAQNGSCRQHDDDWLCIQKELNLINNEANNTPTKVSNVHTQHDTSNQNDMGPVTKGLDFLTESSPADLFPNGCISKGNETKSTTPASLPTNTPSSCSQQNQQPTAHLITQAENHQTDLNEFFSGSEDSEIHKSVESRLEAMFSGSPVHISGSKSNSVDNSDDIESGLESIFGETVKSPNHCGSKNKTTTWGQDLVGNSYIDRSQQQQEQQQPTPATFMNAHHMQQEINSANNARWMQNMETQFSDFMSSNTTTINSSTSDCLVAAGRKRSWNGNVMGNESSDIRGDEDNVHKKLCTNVNGLTPGSSSSSSPLPQVPTHPPHNTALPTDTSHAQDLMEAALLSLHDGLGVENTANDAAPDTNGFSHILSHQNHFGSYNNHLHANGQQNHYASTNATHHNMTQQDLNNHMLHISHHQSQHQANNHNNVAGAGGEFDDDITRHVQNAIDSILNLQSTESDSLPFSLDHSMGSFLSDSILDDRQSTNGQSSCQELAKRRQLVDELGDCLMVNASTTPTNNVVDNAMLMDTSANHAQLMSHNNIHHAQAMHHSHHINNNETVAAVTTATAAATAVSAQHNQINDFSCVVSGIDEAVKSIMSS